ncbi:MAG: hypothetical protein KatS3mg008_0675 [Acidimicrobiales bacterium]|nr:MAG: hypothetical protein KatS3mg008_0675 [Acidimicrobiales bacterium]
MAGKIRIYELARELGITNKECLALCEELKIGAKSHSSSIAEAQADRVRRKAEREGLLRKPSGDGSGTDTGEPVESVGTTTVAKQAKATGRRQKKAADAVGGTATDSPGAEQVTDEEVAKEAPAVSSDEPAPVGVRDERPAAAEAGDGESGPSAEQPVTGGRPAEVPGRVAPREAVTSSGREPGAGVVSSSGRLRRPGVDDAQPEAPRARSGPVTTGPSKASPLAGTTQPSGRTGGSQTSPSGATPPRRIPPPPPLSPSGKPIPPPPPPVRSPSGRPIPPPPGRGRVEPGARRPGAPGGTSRRGPGRPSMRPPGRPGGPPAPDITRGGPPGPGKGAPSGRGRGAPPRRKARKSKRRRREEELTPIDRPTYTPTDAPVPEGEVIIERGSTPQEVGPKLNRTSADVVRFLMEHGEMVMATQSLTDDMIELFAAEIGAQVRIVDPGEVREVELRELLQIEELEEWDADESRLQPRPPVVTVMGHVDHGKTLLLDRIRETNVVEGEAGGITQHIGAYQVEKDGRRITFIDTPGHEAFTAMRARGARVTDIVVLVVAADDGVMPQTEEAIDHARAAGVPIIVAINKIDKPNANPQRVRQQLSEKGLVPEDWGGDTVTVEISALQGTGIDDLLEHILLVAELEELRADPDGRARGTVLESALDVGRGPVATVLVQRGTLRVGDPIVAGAAHGKVRALLDDRGRQLQSAGPGTPVQVLGLSEVVDAGDEFVVAPDEKTAARVAEAREQYRRQAELGRPAGQAAQGVRLEDLFQQLKAGQKATLNVVLKADTHGSVEALTASLERLGSEEVELQFIRQGVGGITENDVQLAVASGATVIGFNVRPDRKARELAEREGVEIRTYEVIYDLVDDVRKAMVGMLAPTYEEVVTGEAEVRQVFRIPRVGAVAGCYVRHGTITRGSKVRFLRDGVVIWKGTISSLKRFKDDVREVQAGYECGVGLSDFQDLKPGDVIETYEERAVERSLDEV